MTKFVLNFDLKAYQDLDNFSLLACQKYNYSNSTDWFGSFRGGLHGSYARVHGVVNHYYNMHAWVPRQRTPSETEYHIASLFFNMDSAIECITFSLNALGFCASNGECFWDITKSNKLKKISPFDLLGRPNENPPKTALSEYDTYFPEVKLYWESKIDFLHSIFEQHDVSKHRETIFSGGMCRNDPPPGFFKSLGLENGESAEKMLYRPIGEISVKRDPKVPRIDRTPTQYKDRVLLDDLVLEFKEFIEVTGIKALQDANQNIDLKVTEFVSA